MVGEDDRRTVADLEVFRRNRDSLRAQIVHLLEQFLRVNDRAVAEHVDNAFPEDAGGQEVQRKLAVFVDDGMARVIAALIADNHIVIGGDEIDHATFAFVTPVDPHNCTVSHVFCSFQDRSASV
ncbi:hypothetical protein SDC9_106106 [bioreactor metagenome]|uniref:Uncharacterized protein n=1 Tax=bioreactor metagenome TaxID=1076179 RepID=A0A645B2H3_9ZZZZ